MRIARGQSDPAQWTAFDALPAFARALLASAVYCYDPVAVAIRLRRMTGDAREREAALRALLREQDWLCARVDLPPDHPSLIEIAAAHRAALDALAPYRQRDRNRASVRRMAIRLRA